jgi:membrane-associated protease RseP (regulator of RpoE activity)
LEEEEHKRVTFNYGIVMLRTRRGLSLMDRISRFRVVRPLSWFMLFLVPVSAGLIFYVVIKELLIFLSPQGVAVASDVREIAPQANLLLPGLNPYIPVVYGLIAIIVAVTIHEFSHGVVARSLGMRVKSVGIIFLVIVPIGAFVEVDEKELRETRPSNSLRVLGAGAGINLIVGIACLALLIFSVSAMTPTVNGAVITCSDNCAPANYDLPSPAYQHGIIPGDVIVAINNIPVNDLDYALRQSGDFQPGQVVSITVWRNGQTSVVNNVTLATVSVIITNTVTNTTQTIDYPYLGVGSLSYATLKADVSNYANAYAKDPALYILPPSFPGVAQFVPAQYIPFSDLLIGFYHSPLGEANSAVDNLLFWVFFVNFNLAIFNCLPIYPMDGGQALERFLVGIGRGKITNELATRITTIVTIAVVLLLVVTIAGPYLGLF